MTYHNMNDAILNAYAESCATEIIDETIKPCMADNGGELGDYLGEALELAHEYADGSEYVVYYHKAHAICLHCNTDAGEEFLEETGNPDPCTYDSLATTIAYGELRNRIEKALTEIIEGDA